MSDWRLHDLRSRAPTGMVRLGVAGIYNRFGYLPEMREALEQWDAHVAQIRQAYATSCTS